MSLEILELMRMAFLFALGVVAAVVAHLMEHKSEPSVRGPTPPARGEGDDDA